ncbi:hypothetical protein MMC16_001248 [Acarospora aff. strigata]|nr:hypothetical protein [Acarospora aff. strigata]
MPAAHHDEVEILVHISAPSGAKDDARYRKQAHGFLGFEAAKRHIVLRPGNGHNKLEAAAATTSAPAPNISDRETLYSPSKLPKHAIGGPRTAASTVVQSSTQSRPQTAPSAATPPFAGTRSIRRTQSDSWGTPPSVVPDSQPLVPPENEGPVNRRDSPHPTLDEPQPKRRRLESTTTTPPIAYASTSPPNPQPRTLPVDNHPPAPPPQPQHFPPATSSPPPSVSPPPSPAFPPIHPPPPQTTSLPFKTHITPTLALLATHVDLPKRYIPRTTTRPLRPLERGHWAVSCDTFAPALRIKIWKFLTDLVGGGRAGWGVWCEWVTSHPEEESDDASAAGVEGDKASKPRQGDDRKREQRAQGNQKRKEKEMIRFYCWGEVAPHIYIVLFLATSRMIKGTGARWVDGGGNVVVQMP